MGKTYKENYTFKPKSHGKVFEKKKHPGKKHHGGQRFKPNKNYASEYEGELDFPQE